MVMNWMTHVTFHSFPQQIFNMDYYLPGSIPGTEIKTEQTSSCLKVVYILLDRKLTKNK